jgi:hypothetical protein
VKLFDLLTSTRHPSPGTPKQTPEELWSALLGLNRDTAPYQVIDGRGEGVDLIAEWKIVDAQWYEIFAKAGLKRVFRIYLKFDAGRHQVRAQDRAYTVTWRAGLPTLSASVEAFRGQQQSIEFGTAYGFTETLAFGQVYKYRFSTREIKKPIQDAVAECGWTYKGVAFGRL